MRFLADQGISPVIVNALIGAGHEAVHVRTLGMSRADDPDILDRAERDGSIVITEDTDFGGLLVPTARTRPSVILFRDRSGRTATRVRLLLANLPQLETHLDAGSLVVLDEGTVRVRRLGGMEAVE